MKAKKVIKVFRKVRKHCKGSNCKDCHFSFNHDGNRLCALRYVNSKVGWEAFQIGVKEVFR